MKIDMRSSDQAESITTAAARASHHSITEFIEGPSSNNQWVDHHRKRCAYDTCDWRDVADEIEVEIVVERSVDRCRRANQEERIAVRRRSHDRRRGDIAAGTRPILDVSASTVVRPVERFTREFRETKSALISAILAFVGIGLAGFIAIWLIRDLGPRAVHWW
jgi:hypothetical protein